MRHCRKYTCDAEIFGQLHTTAFSTAQLLHNQLVLLPLVHDKCVNIIASQPWVGAGGGGDNDDDVTPHGPSARWGPVWIKLWALELADQGPQPRGKEKQNKTFNVEIGRLDVRLLVI